MVSILCRRCRQRLSLDQQNWATMSAPATKTTKPRQWRGFVVLVLGQHSNLQPSLAYEPSHNLKADTVKKSLRWSDFKRKVEHGEAARRLRWSSKLSPNLS